MYFSQNAIILVMLMFVISAVFYSTIEYKTKSVEDSIEIKKISLIVNNLKTTLNKNLDKAVENAFVKTSWKIMDGELDFFNTSKDAENYVESLIKEDINKSLSSVSDNNIVSFTIKDVSISPVNDKGNESPLYVKVKCSVTIWYSKKLKNGYIHAYEHIPIEKHVKLSRVPDCYLYRNPPTYNWSYEKIIYVKNFPNDGKNHTFYIILNTSNFNYNRMNNASNKNEIRIVKQEGNKQILLPYWISKWEPYGTSVIWIKASKNDLWNYNSNNETGIIKILYGSNKNVLISKENPKEVFKYFNNSIELNNGEITLDSFNQNEELLVYANFGEYGFSNGYPYLGIKCNGINYYIIWLSGEEYGQKSLKGIWHYTGYSLQNINTNDFTYVGNYTKNFYIYAISYINSSTSVGFTIFNENMTKKYNDSSTTNLNNLNSYDKKIVLNPQSGDLQVNWVAVKDVNNITTTLGDEYSNPKYTETIPIGKTIYYGEPGKYKFVENGNYSLIGLFTGAKDSWGSVGYKYVYLD